MNIYKKCKMCGTEWASQMEFLADPLVCLNGYQSCFTNAADGLLMFTHNRDDCHSTLSLIVGELEHLYTGPRYNEYFTGDNGCPLYCLDPTNFTACKNPCAMAWVRTVIQELLKPQCAMLSEMRTDFILEVSQNETTPFRMKARP
jgi:hypothetical protein